MPALHGKTQHLTITQDEKTTLFEKFVGCLVKLLASFVYQEHYVKVPEEFYALIPMEIAAAMLPYVNHVASKISGFPQTDEAVNNSKGVYPGDDKCRHQQPHSLWHEESASGLLELIFVTDYIHKVLKTAQDRYDQGLTLMQY